MQFDDAQAQLLTSLSQAGAVCHIPFFANTLPLGYHYLKSVRQTTSSGRLRWHNWKQAPIPVQLDSITEPHVFYAAEKSLTPVLSEFENRNLAYARAFVTQYVPRRFFMEYSIGLDHASRVRRAEVSSDLIDEINRNVDCLEILTDIPEQAHLVEILMRDRGLDRNVDVRTITDELEAISVDDPTLRVVRLYFYGGPITSSLSRQPREFLAFELNSFDDREEELFKTYVCVVSFSEDHRVKDFCEKLASYHKELFRCAEEDRRQLTNVWWTYNRCADVLQHKSHFPTVEDFANCLVEHHKASYRLARHEIRDRPPENKLGDHVHFGAGNLSLGLVLPLLRGRRRIAIIQRQSGGDDAGFSWRKLKSWKTITLKNVVVGADNKVHQTKLKVAFDDGERTNADEVYANWDDTPLFVCTNNPQKFRKFIEEADSLSASVGTGQDYLKKCLERLTFEKKVCLYSFENVHDVRDYNTRIQVVRVLPDRICTDRHFVPGRRAVAVRSEPYVELVVQGSATVWAEVWGLNSQFTLIDSDDEYVFFQRRKRYLVNAVHLVLAVYGYHLLKEMGVDIKRWEDQYIPLLEYAILSGELSPFLRSFVDLQILRLITETGDETLVKLFGTTDKEAVFYELRSYSKGILARMLSVSDTLKRVLDLKSQDKVKRKYSEHFKEPQKWLNRRQEELRRLSVRERLLYCDIDHVLQDAFDKLLGVSLPQA